MYRLFLTVGLTSAVFWPVLYHHIWEPLVVFRNYKYFDIRMIEHTYCGKFELLCGWIMAFTFVVEGDIIFNKRYELSIFMQIILLCILLVEVLLIDFLGNKLHRCLPMRNSLDVAEMIASVESEAFKPIGKYVWDSEHWIRIGNQFYPKSAVTLVNRKRVAKTQLFRVMVHTIDGKAHGGIVYSGSDPAFIESLFNINKALPIRDLFNDKEWKSYQWKLASDEFNCVKATIFENYMQTHTTIQLIENSKLVEDVIEHIDTLENLDPDKKELELKKLRAREATS